MSFQYSDSDRYLTYFHGAIIGRVLQHPSRAFSVEVTFHFDHPQMLILGNQKPPPHFHPWQCEYFEVLEGELMLDLEGKERLVRQGDGEICIARWTTHRIYNPIKPGSSGSTKVVVLVSGEKTEVDFALDITFFENWYAYQDLVVTKGQMPNLFQLMTMWDAGDSYLSPPWWLPFGKTLSLVCGIVVGRWLGGLIGYQPYFREWTSDWALACDRMVKISSQKRFAIHAKQE